MTLSEASLDGYLTYAVSQAAQALHRGISGCLSREGISIEQWRILKSLKSSAGLTMGEIAEVGLLTLPTATKNIDRMVSRALVYRKAHPLDKRKIVVHVSTNGLDVLQRVDACITQQQELIDTSFGEQRTARLIGELYALIDCLTPAARVHSRA